VIRLEKAFGRERLDRACCRALAIRSPSYRTVSTMLKNQMESAPMPGPIVAGTDDLAAPLVPESESLIPAPQQSEFEWEKMSRQNVRGSGYYH